ncbi:hypothetical protein FC83_GL001821 [Agrilactobacillus composti DSM 18527 = JCM 14202]|jgi:nucleotide-binding universal stress UspA family protein|uniref:UspA domain-containing protein n=1 Tax=Agrilactobacillus composti DSM 18527 = JCM 14202 TaxID=1423734 RepID=A0A0R1XLQ3_9LACO|nr:universal stress protein [Agrilactobacillus composti]KRM30685.1 hypothetical protein FC83_GL001821 [Agrilactobacillus composti DSM 18527 = JCM 14202]MCH4170767.1 universal stress protein [Lactobacillus sp.]
MAYKNILIATDGSAQAQKAFDQAVDLAKTFDAKLYIVEVVEPLYYDRSTEVLPAARANAKSDLEKLATTAKGKGLTNFETRQEEGSPREIIAENLPKELNIDLIVISATGRSRTERLLLGSVSDYVSRRAKTQVLIVR